MESVWELVWRDPYAYTGLSRVGDHDVVYASFRKASETAAEFAREKGLNVHATPPRWSNEQRGGELLTDDGLSTGIYLSRLEVR